MRPRTSRSRFILIPILAALLSLPSIAPAPAFAGPIRITQVTVREVGTRLVVGIVATGQILFNITEISTPLPPRIAIDILNAVADPRVRVSTEVQKGNVLRVRVGQFQDSPAIARVVVDLARPVSVDVQRPASNVLTVGVPLLLVTEAQAKAASAPVPTRPAAMVPAVSAAPGTGVVRTAQQPRTAQLPGAPPGPGLIRLLEFRGVTLADVLSALAKLCGFNLVTDSSVQGSITLRLVDVTCEESLRFVLEANGLAFRRLGKNIIVSSAEKLAPPPEVPETISYRLAFGDVNQIRAAVAAAVPGIRVAVDPRTNSLLITGTSAQHEEVTKVLASLDIRIPQLVIQLHAVEVSATALKDLGLLGGQGTAATGAQTFGSFVLDSANNALSFTLQDATLFFFRLRSLVTEDKGRILTAPRVATLDGNKATITLGDRIPIFTTTTTATATTTAVTFVDTGVKFEVTPRVNAEGVITLGIKPEVTSVTRVVTAPDGSTQAPQLATRTADTTVAVLDGQTVVLGGLISREERESTLKVPLLGDIPILGELFRFRNTDNRETEVIFLITPVMAKDGSTP